MLCETIATLIFTRNIETEEVIIDGIVTLLLKDTLPSFTGSNAIISRILDATIYVGTDGIISSPKILCSSDN